MNRDQDSTAEAAMASGARIVAVDPFDYVVFGGTGDLAFRKLLPALYHRFCVGQMPPESRILGVSRRAQGDDEYRAAVRAALAEFVPANLLDDDQTDAFIQRLFYVTVDVMGDDGWADLNARLQDGANPVRAYYLAVSPSLFGQICEKIAGHELATPETRVVIEKPIGHDGASARVVNDAVGKVFDEHQVFRIDHFLGKETVQNLMALRFANTLLEPLWNSAHIDHVQITVAESIGVEGRGGYYDGAGALRDMVQNHILQLLCLVALEPPSAMHADAMRDEKLKVLRALRPIDARNADKLTVRGQYRAGAADGQAVPGYRDESGIGETNTETFVALRAEVANWRWSGVPFYLRTGKRLADRVSEIIVTFKEIPHSIFQGDAGKPLANTLVIRLQPDEGVKLWLMIKDPGPGGMRLRHVPLDMSFAEAFDGRNPDAYERLLMDVVRGDQTLFMRRDEVEAAWDWIDPILAAWAQSDEAPKSYVAGSWGPSAAIALVEREGRTWHEDLA
jgi:glucose-6-phosphate 1-dehydrogenase